MIILAQYVFKISDKVFENQVKSLPPKKIEVKRISTSPPGIRVVKYKLQGTLLPAQYFCNIKVLYFKKQVDFCKNVVSNK